MIDSVVELGNQICEALSFTTEDLNAYFLFEERDGKLAVKERRWLPPTMGGTKFKELMKELEAEKSEYKGRPMYLVEKGQRAEGSEEKEPQDSEVGIQEPQPVTVKLSQLQYDVFSPRKTNKKWINHLKEAIDSEGPESFPLPKVRVHPNGEMAEQVYQLIDGEHFCKALEELGIETVTVQVLSLSDEEADFQAMRLNQIHGKPLEQIEEAKHLQKMMDKYGLSQEQVGKKFQRSQSWVNNRLALLKVGEEKITRVITPSHAREIASAPEEVREEIAEKVGREALSSRDTHAVVGAIKEVPKKKPEILATLGRPKVFQCGIPGCLEGTYDSERYDGIRLCADHRDLFNKGSGAVEKLKVKKPCSPQKVEKKISLPKRPTLKVFPLPWESYTDLTEVATQYECFIRENEEFFRDLLKALKEREKNLFTREQAIDLTQDLLVALR